MPETINRNRRGHRLNYAPHIRLTSPDDVLFAEHAGSNPIDQIKFIATFHARMEGGNVIENIDMVWDKIACFQIADVPRRTEPNSGERNYKVILNHIHAKDYTGLVEMEHFISQPGAKGEQAVLEIYDALDDRF